MDAYVPGFEYDIFLSYAHLNNLNPSGGFGWVNIFHEYLKLSLAEKAGRSEVIKIWYDQKKLDGTQIFNKVISERIKNSALFVALTSKAYYESEYCQKELKAFCGEGQDVPVHLMIGERHRIVNVRLENIPPDKKLEQMGQTLGFSFHNARREDDAWAGVRLKNGDPAYEKEMENLVQAIYNTLEAFRKAGGRSNTSLVTTGYTSKPKAAAPSQAGEIGQRVFLCYVREDGGFALALAKKLKDAGVTIWVDQWDIMPGANWDRAIDEALDASTAFLIILSPAALESMEVQGELRTALDQKKRIVPVLCEACRVPRQLRVLQTVTLKLEDLENEGSIRRLAIALRSGTISSIG